MSDTQPFQQSGRDRAAGTPYPVRERVHLGMPGDPCALTEGRVSQQSASSRTAGRAGCLTPCPLSSRLPVGAFWRIRSPGASRAALPVFGSGAMAAKRGVLKSKTKVNASAEPPALPSLDPADPPPVAQPVDDAYLKKVLKAKDTVCNTFKNIASAEPLTPAKAFPDTTKPTHGNSRMWVRRRPNLNVGLWDLFFEFIRQAGLIGTPIG